MHQEKNTFERNGNGECNEQRCLLQSCTTYKKTLVGTIVLHRIRIPYHDTMKGASTIRVPYLNERIHALLLQECRNPLRHLTDRIDPQRHHLAGTPFRNEVVRYSLHHRDDLASKGVAGCGGHTHMLLALTIDYVSLSRPSIFPTPSSGREGGGEERRG